MSVPLETYIEHADENAQRIVDSWWRTDATTRRPDLKDLYDKALCYQRSKGSPEEKQALLKFAETYKSLDDSASPRPAAEQTIVDLWQTIRAKTR